MFIIVVTSSFSFLVSISFHASRVSEYNICVIHNDSMLKMNLLLNVQLLL